MPRPDLSRVPAFYHGYIKLVKEHDLMDAFERTTPHFLHFFETLPPQKRDYRYAEGKWTVKEVLQHIIDGERVFCYRALRFARKDPTPLPGFDENLFAETAKAHLRDWHSLLEEFKAVRRATALLFASFDEEQLNASGTANNHPNYVLGIGYIIVGHAMHHVRVIEERYM